MKITKTQLKKIIREEMEEWQRQAGEKEAKTATAIAASKAPAAAAAFKEREEIGDLVSSLIELRPDLFQAHAAALMGMDLPTLRGYLQTAQKGKE